MVKNWEPEAVQYLEEKFSVYSRKILIRNFKQVAAQRGWKSRTAKAIELKLFRIGLCDRIPDDYFTKTALAAITGKTIPTINRWIERGLNCRKVGKATTAITLKDLKEWAGLNKNKRWLKTVDRETLAWLIGDVEAFRIHVYPDKRSAHIIGRKIMCVDLGLTYSSVLKASQAHGVSSVSIRRAIERNGRCKGLRWQYVDENEIMGR